MATIRKELRVATSADAAWDAARDFGRLHERLVPGFVTDTRLEGADRLVTFASGVTLRERLVSRDDAQRRLVWAIVDGPYAHHNGSLEVHEDGDGGARLVWTSDLLPDELVAPTSASMDQGIAAMARALGGDDPAAS